MKIAIVSDIHYPTRLKSLPDFNLLFKDVNMIWAVGDYVTYEVIELLKATKKECYFVYGNMDEDLIQHNYPQYHLLRLFNRKIGLIHGWGAPWGIRKRILSVFPEKPDIIVYGHTHSYFFENVQGTTYINPGAFQDGNYIILNLTLGVIDVKKYNWKQRHY